MTAVSFPGVVPPERTQTFVSTGVRLNALEWGDPDATPLLLAHGMWDHAWSFAVLAPLLARRFRVIALDARGHGDSAWAHAYAWPADIRDLLNVIKTIGRRLHVVGHSKGGGQVTDTACLAPDLIDKVVNIDGFGPPPFPPSDYEAIASRFGEYLDARRRLRSDWRPYPSSEQLIERRRAANPRLSTEWLRFFVDRGARRSDDGWRWKSDPHMGQGFGPWRPEWIAEGYATLQRPMLAITGTEQDTWGPLPEAILSERLARVRFLEHHRVAGAGHFVHIEQPAATAELILAFLDS
jgi:pimeloyl-ACP methyl ester carboxylesterase